MKVTELLSENFKRLSAHAVLNGKSVTVHGKNGRGKSTFIDAVWVALTGKDIPEQPIKTGEEKAKIEVTVKDLDGSQIIVTRTFDERGTKLTVKTSDGASYKSPQNFLNAKLGNISFEPLEFINKDPRQQKKFLMELLELDFSAIDLTKRQLLDQLQDKANEFKNINRQLLNYPEIEGHDQEIDLSDVYNNHNELISKKENVNASIALLESHKSKLESIELDIKSLENRIAHFKQGAEKHRAEIDRLSQLDLTPVDLGDIQERIKAANAYNDKFRAKKNRQELLNQLDQVSVSGKAIKLALERIEQQRIDMIAKANMPLDGLTFGEDGLLYNGLPVSKEQLSTAKLIELGVKISIALNPNLRIMRVKDASLLDSETLSLIKKAASDNDYQLFIERVSDASEIGFEIEE